MVTFTEEIFNAKLHLLISVIKEILSKCSQDTNLKTLFDKLTAEQRLVNILPKLNKVKLTQAMRFTSGHVLEHANNMSDAPELEELVINNLVIEVVSHHGRPRYILRVILVPKLNAGHLE